MVVLFPSIAWAGSIYGINLSWYQVLNGTASPVLNVSPYNWSAALVKCVYVGLIIGAAFAAVSSPTSLRSISPVEMTVSESQSTACGLSSSQQFLLLLVSSLGR